MRMKKLFAMLLVCLLLAGCVPAMAAGCAEPDEQRMDVKYVCTGFTVVGQPGNPADLPGEQYLCFGADGMCDFAIGGPVVRVPYRVRGDGVYVVNWYGVEFECVPTASGFEMDFYGVLISYAPDQ